MAYTPTDWSDGVTPVDEAHLDHLEAGVVTADANASTALAALPGKADAAATTTALGLKEDKANKGAANGYAPLDATTKVPVANLPAMGAALQYLGDWAAGTYQDGDTVVKDGIAYLCVGGPTAVAPDSAPWGLAQAAATIGTSLPASPIDGQEFVLVDSLTAPTYAWTFKYIAGITDANKWLFIGGSPLQSKVNTLEATSSTTYADLTTPHRLTVPRAGQYWVDWYGSTHGSTSGNGYEIGIKVGATEPPLGTELNMVGNGAAARFAFSGGQQFAAAALDVISMRFRSQAGSSITATNRVLRITPVRVA